MTESLIPLPSSLPSATPSNAPLLAFLNQYKTSTRGTMTRYLSMIVNLIDPAESKQQTPQQVQERLLAFNWQSVDVHFCNKILRLSLEREYSRSTRENLLLALRGIAKQRRILRQITREELQDIIEVGKTIRGGNPVKAAKEIPPEDLVKMLRACEADENKLLGLRDFALLSLLFGSGLRAAEAVALKLSEIDFSANTLTVTGKGGNKRIVYPVEGVLEAIQGWLNIYMLRSDFLFPAFLPPSSGGGVIQGRADKHITYSALYFMVRKRALQAGITVPSPHWFRHSFATQTYRNTKEIYGLQSQLGHKSGETTKRYVAEIEETESKKRASKSWKLPTMDRPIEDPSNSEG